MSDDKEIGLQTSFSSEGDFYQITQGQYSDERVIWQREYKDDEDTGGHAYPADVRAKYEELKGVPEFDPEWTAEKFIANEIGAEANLVELVGMFDEESAWDQPCLYGNRCGGHAVYCHNDGWLYSPRKCRRTWYTGGEVKDEDCPGFHPNPYFTNITQKGG